MGKQLKPGLTIDTHTPAYGFAMGETVYTVCDTIGVIFTTTNPAELERFYVPTMNPNIKQLTNGFIITTLEKIISVRDSSTIEANEGVVVLNPATGYDHKYRRNYRGFQGYYLEKCSYENAMRMTYYAAAGIVDDFGNLIVKKGWIRVN